MDTQRKSKSHEHRIHEKKVGERKQTRRVNGGGDCKPRTADGKKTICHPYLLRSRKKPDNKRETQTLDTGRLHAGRDNRDGHSVNKSHVQECLIERSEVSKCNSLEHIAQENQGEESQVDEINIVSCHDECDHVYHTGESKRYAKKENRAESKVVETQDAESELGEVQSNGSPANDRRAGNHRAEDREDGEDPYASKEQNHNARNIGKYHADGCNAGVRQADEGITEKHHRKRYTHATHRDKHQVSETNDNERDVGEPHQGVIGHTGRDHTDGDHGDGHHAGDQPGQPQPGEGSSVHQIREPHGVTPNRLGFVHSDDILKQLKTNLQPNEGFEFTLAPLYKRILAELIDFIILLFLKFVFLLILNFACNSNEYGADNLISNILRFYIFSTPNMRNILITAAHRVAGLLYEVVWTIGHDELPFFCATPGKILMNIAVITCFRIRYTNKREKKVVIYPATDLGPFIAIERGLLKNVLIPMETSFFWLFYIFGFNRTGYDIISNTVVVEMGISTPKKNF